MFSLNEVNNFGEYEMLDEIPISIAFEITEEQIFGQHKSVWISKYWGRIRLDSMEAEQLRKEK